MINFAVGPVQMDEEIRAIGAEEVPYFRTPEFSAIMKENERLMKQFTGASGGCAGGFPDRFWHGGDGSGSYEPFTERDRVLVVNGGSFGARFAKICEIHEVPHEEIQLESGPGRFGQKTWHRMREKDLPVFSQCPRDFHGRSL